MRDRDAKPPVPSILGDSGVATQTGNCRPRPAWVSAVVPSPLQAGCRRGSFSCDATGMFACSRPPDRSVIQGPTPAMSLRRRLPARASSSIFAPQRRPSGLRSRRTRGSSASRFSFRAGSKRAASASACTWDISSRRKRPRKSWIWSATSTQPLGRESRRESNCARARPRIRLFPRQRLRLKLLWLKLLRQRWSRPQWSRRSRQQPWRSCDWNWRRTCRVPGPPTPQRVTLQRPTLLSAMRPVHWWTYARPSIHLVTA